MVTYVREEWIEGSEFTQKSWLGLIEESDLFSSLLFFAFPVVSPLHGIGLFINTIGDEGPGCV